MARCMLIDAKMAKRFWSKAVLWATYLQNRLPTACVDKTPFKLFKGKKPDVSHLRVFGAKYSHTVRIVEDSTEQEKSIEEPEGDWHPGMNNKDYNHKSRSKSKTEGGDDDDDDSDKEYNSVESHVPEEDDEEDNHEEDPEEDNHVPEENIPNYVPEEDVFVQNVQDVPEEDVSVQNVPVIEKKIENVPDKIQDEASSSSSTQELRRSKRTTAGQPPKRYGSAKLVSAVNAEPSNWKEVQHLPHCQRELWTKAAEQEIKLLNKYQVWDLVDLPPKRKTVSCRWVFKTKLDADGRPHTYKARLVARGFSQKFDEDYDETYASVVRYDTVQVLLATAARKKMYIQQLDVQSAYLNGVLEEEIFMEQPPGFIQKAGKTANITREISKKLSSHFEIRDLGKVSYYLGIKVEHNKNGDILLSQEAKIEQLLQLYQLNEAKPARTPMETATISRPDVAAAVGFLARRVETPTQMDWNAVKRIIRYLAGTKNYKLHLSSTSDDMDADWAGDKQDRKSTSGYIFKLGSSAIAWSSHKQTSVSMSSTEAEFLPPLDHRRHRSGSSLPPESRINEGLRVIDANRSGRQKALQAGKIILKELRFNIPQIEFSVQHWCLLRGQRVVIPKTLQNKVLNELHTAHFGVNKMKRFARSYCRWEGIDRNIENVAHNCGACNAERHDPPKVNTHPWEEAETPFDLKKFLSQRICRQK
ncbi:uncharacterized protein LOC143894862 [Temnothorax americanus]|uniref:uncharacterized protein LOC143894862 n=1 Tax=Temnothorax americanus TaxID=1964332 RepID=UPI004067CB9F